MPTNDVLCPHCGKVMGWGKAQNDWVCPDCGYEGTDPEDPMSYVLPPSTHSMVSCLAGKDTSRCACEKVFEV